MVWEAGVSSGGRGLDLVALSGVVGSLVCGMLVDLVVGYPGSYHKLLVDLLLHCHLEGLPVCHD